MANARPERLVAAIAPQGVPVVRGAVQGVLGRLFGPSPLDPSADLGDPGLFGPGSASWRVLAEPAAIVGGIRGLLLQLLHPLAVAGVADHSLFGADPLGRLHQTAQYVSTTTYGSSAEALRAARAVRAAHRVVVGTAPDGRAYAAADPPLLAWVALSLTTSFLATDRAYAPRPLAPADQDAFVAEQSRAAALLDPRVELAALDLDALRAGSLPLPMIEDDTLPTDVAGLRIALASYEPQLAIGEQARRLLRFLRWPPLPMTVRAGYLPLLAAALATLDDTDARLLGAPPAPIRAALRVQGRVLITAMRAATGPSPTARMAAARVTASPP